MRRFKVPVALFLAAFPCALRAAVEEGHSAASGSTAFLGKAVNSLILFGGLAFLLAKTVRALLDARSAGIARSIREAADSRSDAERRLGDVRARLDGIDRELAGIRADGEDETALAVRRVREAAETEAERLKRLTRLEIELGVRGSLREIRAYAADLAIRSAEARIREALTGDRHARLIDRSIEQLGRLRDEKPSAH